MGKLNDDIRRRVQELRSHVTRKEYEEAIESLKSLGGEYAAFAAAHAALVAVALGAAAGAAFVAATAASTTVGAGLLAGVMAPGIALAYLGGAGKVNDWYENLDSADREALSKVIAYGIRVSQVLRVAWRLIAR